GDFVDANNGGGWGAGAPELLPHVLHLQRLDGLPIQPQLAGDIQESRRATASPNEEGEPFGVEGVLGQPGQPLLFHGATAAAAHPPHLDFQIDACIATGKVADITRLAVVERALGLATDATNRFFRARTSRTMRALGSPKIPRTVA